MAVSGQRSLLEVAEDVWEALLLVQFIAMKPTHCVAVSGQRSLLEDAEDVWVSRQTALLLVAVLGVTLGRPRGPATS